jgi:hypothetical protein
MAMKNCLNARLTCESLSLMVLGNLSKKSLNYGNPCDQKIFMTIFEFIGQLFFQNDVFNLQEVLSELEIRIFLENGLRIFPAFLILQI